MEQHRQAMQQEFHRRFRTPDAPEHRAGGDEKEAWEEDWDDEKMPNEWYEGDTEDPAVSPDRWDERKKHLQRQLRDIEKLTDMDQVLRDGHKES